MEVVRRSSGRKEVLGETGWWMGETGGAGGREVLVSVMAWWMRGTARCKGRCGRRERLQGQANENW